MTLNTWFMLAIAVVILKPPVAYADAHGHRCPVAGVEVNGVAFTHSKYILLAFESDLPRGPVMYVMSRKPPYPGKFYFVEALSSACRNLSVNLRAADGSTAFLVFIPYQCGGDCFARVNDTATIRWGNPSPKPVLESLLFGSSDRIRLFGIPNKKVYSGEALPKNPELETLVLTAARRICQFEFGGSKAKGFADCVDRISGQASVDLEQKHIMERKL